MCSTRHLRGVILLLLFLVGMWRITHADTGGPAFLFKDINQASTGSNPSNFAALNGQVFFAADDGDGTGLWRSDGTAAGTVLVSRTPVDRIVTTQSTVYFTAGCSLCRTNGADAPTCLPEEFCADFTVSGSVGDALFFGAFDPSSGQPALWWADNSGVQRLATFPSWYLFGFTSVNGRLFFFASDEFGGIELWSSDGTAADTTRVKRLTTNPGDAALVNTGDKLFLLVESSDASVDGVWISDGTEGGTVRVAAGSPLPSNGAVSIAGTIFFSAGEEGDVELWKSDGTASGTLRVKDIEPGPLGSFPQYLTVVAERLYFIAWDADTGYELWTSDGTEAGTVRVQDIDPGPASSFPFLLTAVDGVLFFSAEDGRGGRELWRSDGTPSGTRLVKAVAVATGYNNILAVDGTLFFAGHDARDGFELWTSDGTAAGTAQVADINQQPGSAQPSDLTAVGGRLFFSADDGVSGAELWTSDGTSSGTRMLKDIAPGFDASSPRNLVNAAGTLFFTAFDETGFYRHLWKSGGTEDTTIQLTQTSLLNVINDGPLVAIGSTVFFVNQLQETGMELWKSDGTPEGTGPVLQGTGPSYMYDLTSVGETLYFIGTDTTHGSQVWRSDDTASSTVMVTQGDQAPDSLVNVNGSLFYHTTGVAAELLWKADGPGGEPLLVASFARHGEGPAVSWMSSFLDALFFFVSDPLAGEGLWKSGGTGTDTALVKAIQQPSYEQPPLVPAGSTGFFVTADSQEAPGSLWRTDGTAAGTLQLLSGGSPGSFRPVRSTLLFSVTDGAHGYELWGSDGTVAGTRLLQDIDAGQDSSSPDEFTVVGGQVFFSATDAQHGRELWAMPLSAVTPACVGDCGGNGQVTVDAILTLVNIALGNAPTSACADGVPSGTEVDIALILQAVNSALDGCGTAAARNASKN